MKIIRARCLNRRSAMTLLELLLALALCGLLMSATGASLHLMMQLRNRSQTQVSETQTIRALLDQIARDLRSVRRISDVEGVTRRENPRLEQSLDLRKSQLNLHTSSVVPVELIGTSTWLSLHTDHSESSVHAGSTASGQRAPQLALPQHTDGLHVVWWNGDSRTIPYASDGFRVLETRVQGLREFSGPARASFPVTQNGERSILNAEPLTIGAAIRFRYFDGVAWRESWDSTELRCLPRAIECRVQLGREKSESMVIALSTAASLTSSRELPQR